MSGASRLNDDGTSAQRDRVRPDKPPIWSIFRRRRITPPREGDDCQ